MLPVPLAPDPPVRKRLEQNPPDVPPLAFRSPYATFPTPIGTNHPAIEPTDHAHKER